jgi:ABC-2 type transport system ATP-binding protein
MITIKAVGLTKKFASNVAVNELSLEIEEGEIFGLVGPDGAGKTTTMRLLTGILEPTSGEGWVYGKHILKESESLKDHIAYMSQRFGLYEDLTVMENLNFYADIFGVSIKKRTSRIDRLMDFSNLTPFKNRLARNLSGGMKQKLGLSCALVHTPKVLFLDEPTSGVDPVSRRDFWQILYELLKENVTILFSTSYLDEAERCRRVGLIHKGRLLKCDIPANIKNERKAETLEEAFISIINEYDPFDFAGGHLERPKGVEG